MTAEAETPSYSVRVSGDGENDALLRALEDRPSMRVVVRGGAGMLPSGGSSDLSNLSIKSYSLWVEGVGSEDEAREAVESLLADIGVPGGIQDVRRLSG